MNILITGAKGFIAKNLTPVLRNIGKYTLYEMHDYRDLQLLDNSIQKCELVIHLETIYRTNIASQFHEVNTKFTEEIVNRIKNKAIRMIYISTANIDGTNEYSISKKEAENLLIDWYKKYKSELNIIRLSNEFGKWCLPYENSVVSTFSYNFINGIESTIIDPDKKLNLVYIDDIIEQIINIIEKKPSTIFVDVKPTYQISVSDLHSTLNEFNDSRLRGYIPNLSSDLRKKLYSTFISYLNINQMELTVNKHEDERGFFAEIFHSNTIGQISVNSSLPGITKGNHWHQTKYEKFCVIKGEGTIKLKNLYDDKIIEFIVSDKRLTIIDIPPGYLHNITNCGSEDMLTLMWCNENYIDTKPDTYKGDMNT